jgi:stage III sporulation protein AG
MVEKIKAEAARAVKNPKILMAVGLIGIFLIGFSSLFSKDEKKEGELQPSTIFSSVDYADSLENSLKKSIGDMIGSNRVSVLVTLDSGVEYIYADEIKENNENEVDSDKTQQKGSNEKSYVLFRDSSGNERPLTVTEIMPRIKGVVVVCAGGESDPVKSAVTAAVTTALDISETRVCVMGYSHSN